MTGGGDGGQGVAREEGFQYVPDDVQPAVFPRLSRSLLDGLASVDGLTAAIADVLDDLGLASVVDASTLSPRAGEGVAVGHAVTVRYLPTRRAMGERSVSGLATAAALRTTEPGDVLVVDAGVSPLRSTFGGNAAISAMTAGVSGVVVDGAIRDLEEMEEIALPIWSRAVTPRTGRWELQAVAINGAISCGGIQVRAGDLVCADRSGICFVPGERANEVAERTLTVAQRRP